MPNSYSENYVYLKVGLVHKRPTHKLAIRIDLAQVFTFAFPSRMAEHCKVCQVAQEELINKTALPEIFAA